jgi:hypothetical protein
MRIDESTLCDLIDLSDPLGVVSVYVENSTAQAADPQPTSPLEIRPGLCFGPSTRNDLTPSSPRPRTEPSVVAQVLSASTRCAMP